MGKRRGLCFWTSCGFAMYPREVVSHRADAKRDFLFLFFLVNEKKRANFSFFQCVSLVGFYSVFVRLRLLVPRPLLYGIFGWWV